MAADRRWAPVLLIGIFWATLFLFPAPAAAANSSDFTWSILTVGNLELRLGSNRCMTATGSQDLNVTVYRRPGSSVSTTATVTGDIYKPQGGLDGITFVSQGDGNYSKNYSFSQTGTYKLVLHATDINYTAGDLNEYIYAQDFDFDISFVNNSFSVTAGNTGTIQNYVQNSDDNAVTGLTGSIDINYPSGTSFVDDGVISETGNGNYYYNFTAPATSGVYTAASSFTCGPNTDVNRAGRFTVSETSGGGTGDSGGSDGDSGSGGGSGGGGGGGGASSLGSWDQTLLLESSAFAIGQTQTIAPNERVKFIVNGGAHYLGLLAVRSDVADIVVSSTPQRATLHVGEILPFELTGDAFFDLEVTLRKIEDGKADFLLKSIHTSIEPIDGIVAGWSFAEPAEVGAPNRLKLILRNTGSTRTAFLVKATISQGQENEYFDTMLTPLLEPRETFEIQLDEPYTTFVSGDHLLHVQLFTPDGGEKVGEYAKNFNIGGLLRYDVVATCLEPSVVPGKEISALLNLVNQGDYFQDMQFSWWVEGEEEQKIGMGTFPIALYNKESRSLVRSVLIPSDATPGNYIFHAQLAYESTLIEGSCSFLVQTTKDYYLDELGYAQSVLEQIETITKENPQKSNPEILGQINELKLLLVLFERAIESEDYAVAEKNHLEIREKLRILSRLVIDQKTGFFDNVNLPQIAITVLAVVLTAGSMLAIQAKNAQTFVELGKQAAHENEFADGPLNPIREPEKTTPSLWKTPGVAKRPIAQETAPLLPTNRPTQTLASLEEEKPSILSRILGLKPPRP